MNLQHSNISNETITMDAKAYAARNRQGSDWFGHNPESAGTMVPHHQQQNHNNVEQENVGEAPLTSRTQMIKPVCNSNQWFRHEGGGDSVTDAPKRVEPEQEQPQACQKATTLVQEQVEVVSEKMEMPSQSTCGSLCFGSSKAEEPKVRSHTREAEANFTRDKTGSDWFSHDEQGGARPTSSMSGSRIGSLEGSQNASRMRGESENWFSHDPNAPPQPLHSSKHIPTCKR
ncbi:hypothetical protein HELRODRAFT_167174 [Helobdella robusta]|uniref:Uncharacterized protein n=1 Tax=Helobdella robusta TaxID=6412 RepID=T1EZ35_HELRO|nr:hypothetical protein HELRODRAFT_167174 [Helobdella robusta]ESO10668.1 hypothetical protein HELRODRAFT_167174 [Helobdella robusta]